MGPRGRPPRALPVLVLVRVDSHHLVGGRKGETQRFAVKGVFPSASLGSCRMFEGEVEVQGDVGEGSRPRGTLPSIGCHYQRSPVLRNVLPGPAGVRAVPRQR